MDILPKNLKEIPGWVPKDPLQNRQVSQNSDRQKIPIENQLLIKEGDILAQRYQVLSKLGQGKFGTVFHGFNISTKQQVAIKTESRSSPIRLLKNETTVLKYLYDQGCRCCPIIYWYGIYLDTSCIVFSYYTISLYDYLHIKPIEDNKKLHIMRTCIEMLESIHTHFVIHRDIKPQNFMIRDGELYMIDFGLATFYIDSKGEHIEDIITENLVGTPKFISYNVHCGHTASRRDDMLSLGYMFLCIQSHSDFFSTPPSDLVPEMELVRANLMEHTVGIKDRNRIENKHNFPITHMLHPSNVYLKDKKSWYLLENLCSKYDSIYRYLEHCYRIPYEGSPLYGELQKLFVEK